MDDRKNKLPITFPHSGRKEGRTSEEETRDSQNSFFARAVLLTPTKNAHVDKRPRTLELALDQPLGNALESIFSHQGNVLITFPRASDFQVST